MRESAIIRFMSARKNFCVRSVSAVLWMAFILLAVALAAYDNYRYDASIIDKMLVALPDAMGFFMFLLSYQLVLAISIGNALTSESSLVHRIWLALIYFFTFAIMLLNVLVSAIPRERKVLPLPFDSFVKSIHPIVGGTPKPPE